MWSSSGLMSSDNGLGHVTVLVEGVHVNKHVPTGAGPLLGHLSDHASYLSSKFVICITRIDISRYL